MGCGTSKTDGVSVATRNGSKRLTKDKCRTGKCEKENVVPGQNAKVRREAEQLADLPGAVTEKESELDIPKPISFEISTKEDHSIQESIIKKHPPKRLQKLEDQHQITTQRIQEKQTSARERRTQHLQERVQSSKSRRLNSRSALPPKLEPTIPEQKET